MKAVIRHLRANVIQWAAFAVLVSSMLAASRSTFIPMAMGLGRVVMPVLIVWLIYRFVKKRVSSAISKFQDQLMQNVQNAGQGYAAQGAGGKTKNQVLDLCPKCGSLDSPSHQCKTR
jgi:hypothetical protein